MASAGEEVAAVVPAGRAAAGSGMLQGLCIRNKRACLSLSYPMRELKKAGGQAAGG
jgi:hypothetical protein